MLLLLWLLWPGVHVTKPPLTEVLLRVPPKAEALQGLYVPHVPSAIPGAMKGWPAVSVARLHGDSVVAWGYSLDQPLDGIGTAVVELEAPGGTFRADRARVRVIREVDAGLVETAVSRFLASRGSSLWRAVLAYPVVASTDVPFLGPADCGREWCPQSMFWDQERGEVLVRCHTKALPNSHIEHRGHRDLGDRGVAWLRVDPRSGRARGARLTRIEVFWLE